MLHRPGDFLADIGSNQLRTPIAMIGSDHAAIGDVVQQTRQHDLFVLAGLKRLFGAGQQMANGQTAGEAQAKEIEQRRRLRHPGQGGIVAHHNDRAGNELPVQKLTIRVGRARAEAADRRAQDQPAAASLRKRLCSRRRLRVRREGFGVGHGYGLISSGGGASPKLFQFWRISALNATSLPIQRRVIKRTTPNGAHSRPCS